jgi:hypothetical protein
MEGSKEKSKDKISRRKYWKRMVVDREKCVRRGGYNDDNYNQHSR